MTTTTQYQQTKYIGDGLGKKDIGIEFRVIFIVTGDFDPYELIQDYWPELEESDLLYDLHWNDYEELSGLWCDNAKLISEDPRVETVTIITLDKEDRLKEIIVFRNGEIVYEGSFQHP